MGEFVIDIRHPDERNRSVWKINPIFCPDDRPDMEIPAPFYSFRLEVLDHLRLKLDGVAGASPGKEFAERKKEIPRSRPDLGRIPVFIGADQGDEPGRILIGKTFGIVKLCHMPMVKEMGQEVLLDVGYSRSPSCHSTPNLRPCSLGRKKSLQKKPDFVVRFSA
jgi:hypothetical protein